MHTRRVPSPQAHLPRAGRVNQSCLTADIWFHSIIHYLSDQKGQHTAIGESGTESGIKVVHGVVLKVVSRVVPSVVHGTGGTEGGIEGGMWCRFILDI